MPHRRIFGLGFARLLPRKAGGLPSRFAVAFASRRPSVFEGRRGPRRIVPVETTRADVELRVDRIHSRWHVLHAARPHR